MQTDDNQNFGNANTEESGSSDKKIRSTRKKGYKTTVERAKFTAVLCLAVIAITLFLMSPVFRIETIDIKGETEVEESVILKASGVKKGMSIFAVDGEDVRKRVMKCGHISNVSVTKSFPDKLVIKVRGKNECAYIKEGNSYTGIDENGLILATSTAIKEKAPVIQGVKLQDSQNGQYIRLGGKKSKEVSSVITRMLTELKNQEIISVVKSIDITNPSDMRMLLRDETLVFFGEDGEEANDKIEYKIAFLSSIITNPDYPKGSEIDLTDTDNVTSRAVEK